MPTTRIRAGCSPLAVARVCASVRTDGVYELITRLSTESPVAWLLAAWSGRKPSRPVGIHHIRWSDTASTVSSGAQMLSQLCSLNLALSPAIAKIYCQRKVP